MKLWSSKKLCREQREALKLRSKPCRDKEALKLRSSGKLGPSAEFHTLSGDFQFSTEKHSGLCSIKSAIANIMLDLVRTSCACLLTKKMTMKT